MKNILYFEVVPLFTQCMCCRYGPHCCKYNDAFCDDCIEKEQRQKPTVFIHAVWKENYRPTKKEMTTTCFEVNVNPVEYMNRRTDKTYVQHLTGIINDKLNITPNINIVLCKKSFCEEE